MIRFVVCFTVALALGATTVRAHPAEPATPGQPTFRGGVTLLAIDVSVLDGDGRPQPGLTADDFEVEIDGRRTVVKTLDYVSVEAPQYTAGVRMPTSGGAGPAAVVPANRANPLERTFLLFVDDLSFGPLEHKSITSAAERFLSTLRPEDRVGLVTSSGRQNAAAGRDRGPVVTALRTVSGRFYSPQRDAIVRLGNLVFEGEQLALSEAVRINRNDQSLRIEVARREGGDQCADDEACLRAIEFLAGQIAYALEFTVASQARAWVTAVRAMSRIDGAKVMVVMSGGLPSELAGSEIQSFSRAVANAGISLHVVGGLRADAAAEDRMFAGSTGTGQDRRSRDNPFFLDGLRDAAARGGGSFYPTIGQSDDDFARILRATSARYRLGVELPPAAAPGVVLKTRVRLKRSGLRVFAASEYTTPGPPPVLTVDAQLRAIVSEGAAHYAVPVVVTPLVRRHPSGGALELGLHVEVPDGTPPPLDVAFAVLGDAGRVVQSGRLRVERTSGGERRAFSLAVPVPPGHYRLRMGVADGTGNVGSSEQLVTARLTKMGGLMASQLFARATGSNGAIVVSGDQIPESATQLEVGMELYRDSASPAGVVREAKITLLTDAGVAVESRTVPLAASETSWNAGVRVPLERLPAGRYAMSFALLEAGVTVASVSRGIMKTAAAVAAATSTEATPASMLTGPASDAPTPTASASAGGGSVPRVILGLPARDDVIALVRQDAASARPAPDVARLLDKAEVVLQLAKITGSSSVRTLPSAAQPDAEFWASIERLGHEGGGTPTDFAGGLAALYRRDWASAVDRLERVLDAAPDALVAMQYLGAANAGIGEDRDAAGAWALSLPATTPSVEWYLAYANVLVRSQDQPGAIAALVDAKARWPDDARVLVRRGELLVATGRMAEARQDLTRAVTLAPNQERASFLLTALAFADVVADPTRDAVDSFEKHAARYLAVVGDKPSPVNEWRRLVAAALKRPGL